MARSRVVVVGAGLFGMTGAIALARRGFEVTVLDPGPLPHPLAASTDISKVVRMDYGADEEYMKLGEAALDGSRRWNADWPKPLFHETGVLFLCRSPMTPGGFEHDSYELLLRRGHRPERIDGDEVRKRFPEWNSSLYVDGYFNREGGYAESSRVISRLVEEAPRLGVAVRAGTGFARLREKGSRVAGVVTTAGEVVDADRVVISIGSWTPHVLPFVSECFRSVGMPVFRLQPEDPTPFLPPSFPVFCADLPKTGYYGMPANQEGIVKVSNHGVGRSLTPESPDRLVTPAEKAHLFDFLKQTFPRLADAPLVYSHVCLYTDTWDGHFWIAADPEREGLMLATGGSGHAFKFAPVLGDIIADALQGVSTPLLERFRWRPELRLARGEEAARCRG